MNSEFLSSTLHLLPLIYPIFTCVDPDPYLEYESGSRSAKLLNSEYRSNFDPDPYPQHCICGYRQFVTYQDLFLLLKKLKGLNLNFNEIKQTLKYLLSLSAPMFMTNFLTAIFSIQFYDRIGTWES